MNVSKDEKAQLISLIEQDQFKEAYDLLADIDLKDYDGPSPGELGQAVEQAIAEGLRIKIKQPEWAVEMLEDKGKDVA